MKRFIRRSIASAAIALSCFTGTGLAGIFNASSAQAAPATTTSLQQSLPTTRECAPNKNVYLLAQPAEKTVSNIGPAAAPRIDCLNTGSQDDLDVSIPGTGIALGGDGAHDYPQINVPGVYEGRNPLPVPQNTRPLPTGTAIGPHGEHYAFYAIVPYNNPDGSLNINYTAPDTVVVDLANPGIALFTLHGISQASGAYDAQSGRMIIVGNTLNGQRALWQSAPLDQNYAWSNTLLQIGTFSGAMDGNRESQIVALPRGGFLIVGAGDTPTNHTMSIHAVTATTPQELLTAAPVAVVPPQALPGAYGPTITDIQEINGKDVISLRISTAGTLDIHGRIATYDPRTYTTTFNVTLSVLLKNTAARKNDSAGKERTLTDKPRVRRERLEA